MKKYKNIRFKIFVFILLLFSFFLFVGKFNYQIVPQKSQTDYYIEHAKSLNINNMVTSIYLGTRSFDTLLEIMVVISTVICMEYLRKE